MTITPLFKNSQNKKMKWNIENITFLHQPDFFLGSFDNPKMQERHERELKEGLDNLKNAIAFEDDPLIALRKLNKNDHIQFLRNNLAEFRSAGRLEETVVLLYSVLNAPFSSGGDASLWRELFNMCNPDLLKKCGTPLPFQHATVYRGSVSGMKKSLVWTPDRSRAEKYADRWKDKSLGGGELFEVDINEVDVLLYSKNRFETIVILSPAFIESANIRIFNR